MDVLLARSETKMRLLGSQPLTMKKGGGCAPVSYGVTSYTEYFQPRRVVEDKMQSIVQKRAHTGIANLRTLYSVYPVPPPRCMSRPHNSFKHPRVNCCQMRLWGTGGLFRWRDRIGQQILAPVSPYPPTRDSTMDIR